ncbi:DUF1542 domain-containing protein, partial [Streptococcus danieliae]
DAEANKAKAAIDAAKTSEEVQTAATVGITAIQAINPEAIAKSAAKDAIDKAAAAKKAAIDARNDLTQEEKDAAKSLVDAEANKAKAAIDAAKTSEEVQTATTAGITAINAINPETAQKEKNSKSANADHMKESMKPVYTADTGQLPNTGEESSMAATAAGVALLGLLTGVATKRRKRKEDEI